MSILLRLTHQSAWKTKGGQYQRQAYDTEEKYFKSLKEVKKHLREEYGMGKHKTTSTYHDSMKKNGTPVKSGWFISFRDKDYDRDTGKYNSFIHEIWASPYKISKMRVR